MKLLCKLFGHRPDPPGWWGDIPYMKIERGRTDGIGRVHGRAYHECNRCGKEYVAGRLHLNDPAIKDACAED